MEALANNYFMQYHLGMDTRQMLEVISEGLKNRGEPGSPVQIANILNVAPSTVYRWHKGEAIPRGAQRQALELLYRTVTHAKQGNEDAKQILGALIGAAGAGLLGLGLGGILIAAGLGWILGGRENQAVEEVDNAKK